MPACEIPSVTSSLVHAPHPLIGRHERAFVRGPHDAGKARGARSSQFVAASGAAQAKHQGDFRSWADLHLGAERMKSCLDARGVQGARCAMTRVCGPTARTWPDAASRPS